MRFDLFRFGSAKSLYVAPDNKFPQFFYVLFKFPAFQGLLMLVACLADTGPVRAANVMYSYNSDLSNASPLANAYVRAGSIYIFLDDQNVLETDIVCCDWLKSVGSRQKVISASRTIFQNDSLQLDLAGVSSGSVRSLKTLADGETLTFTVQRAAERAGIQLRRSGAVKVTQSGQIIENLLITANENDECGISILDKSNITIRNVRIEHKNRGICVQDSSGLVINTVQMISTSAPLAGPHCDFGRTNCNNNKAARANPDERLSILLNNAPGAVLEHLQMEKGSGGLWGYRSNNLSLHDFVCFDIRGPYPRGQCVQMTESNGAVIKNFYAKNFKGVSRSEDNFNFYESDNAVISDGLVDGNWSVNGVGIIADRGADNLRVSNIDFLETGSAAVSVWSNDLSRIGRNLLAENIRVKNTHCDARDGRVPSSGGLVVAAQPESINPVYRNVQYANHCREQVTWCMPGRSCRKNNTGSADIREKNFSVREPLELQFPWERSAPAQTLQCS